MKFAVQYSPQAEQLLTAGTIDFDYFKCPPWADVIERIAPLRPCYVHFELNAGGGAIPDAQLDTVEHFLTLTDTPYVNVHLVATTADFPDIPAGSDTPEHLEMVAEQMVADVSQLTRQFGTDRVIAENVIYRGPNGRFLWACVAPTVISEVVRQTGCGLLLDTAHATMTCKYTNRSFADYLDKLPTQTLRELHVTGIGHDGDKWRDSMPLRDEDFSHVHQVLAQVRNGAYPEPWVMTLEYGGVGLAYEWRSDPEVLQEHVPRLRAKQFWLNNRNPTELSAAERHAIVESNYDPRFETWEYAEFVPRDTVICHPDGTETPLPGGWDHSHCVFCSRRISRYPGDDSHGYVSPDFNWLCTRCYETNVKLLHDGVIDWDESYRCENQSSQEETERQRQQHLAHDLSGTSPPGTS